MRVGPISFTLLMLKAINSAANPKTQTRRVVKFNKPFTQSRDWEVVLPDGVGGWIFWDRGGPGLEALQKRAYPKGGGKRCPYGDVGDRLWVRESVLIDGWYDGDDDKVPLVHAKDPKGVEHTLLYRLDCPDLVAIDDDGSQRFRKDGSEASPWKSSRFMPRWAARTFLEIVEPPRPERLHTISPDDIIAEGVPISKESLAYQEPDLCRAVYQGLWDSINGKTHPWVQNDWVWRIVFKRLEA
jgi:hypothetical protein